MKSFQKKVLEIMRKNSITGFLIGLITILKQWTHRKWVLQKIFSDSFFHIISNWGLNPKTLCCVCTLSRWHWFKSFTKKRAKMVYILDPQVCHEETAPVPGPFHTWFFDHQTLSSLWNSWLKQIRTFTILTYRIDLNTAPPP